MIQKILPCSTYSTQGSVFGTEADFPMGLSSQKASKPPIGRAREVIDEHFGLIRWRSKKGMGSFDGPIKLTFSLDAARRTLITKVVCKKRKEKRRGSEDGRRPKSDEALSLSFNPIVRYSLLPPLGRRTFGYQMIPS